MQFIYTIVQRKKCNCENKNTILYFSLYNIFYEYSKLKLKINFKFYFPEHACKILIRFSFI